jgi:thiol-disulfide isomerase/thioredoxin
VNTPVLTLRVGDQAPSLRSVTWLKDDPGEHFIRGKVYVVEFWATWCGPCSRSSAHLSDLAKKYTGRVTIIGISTREMEKARNVDVAFIADFVRRNSAQMDYSVAMDDIARNRTYREWANAAGLSGIPVAFIVDQESRTVWAGHPEDLETPLVEALEGRIDLVASQSSLDALVRKQSATKVFREAMQREDWPAAIAEANVRIQEQPLFEVREFWAIVAARLHFDADDAMRYARKKAGESDFVASLGFSGGRASDAFLDGIAGVIAGQRGLPTATYAFAVQRIEAILERSAKSYYWWNALAQLRTQLGEFQGAVRAMERALEGMESMPQADAPHLQTKHTAMKQSLEALRARVGP